ncbi:sulfurtransferase TusA family protein [Acidimangrovimonas sediminis]|uniref:sulfurtransferase TusA family protein n=1 Tax=Acidimangrovimonas sediminis TaxID=2056283 RepID=UPI000C7FC9FD|nr:sulfurtransferase TusA family protein [Acidimangrovimonas sediminis]
MDERIEELDAEGLLCPLPVLKTRKRLAALAPGALLRVRTTDPAAEIDLPVFCAQAGHDLVSVARDGGAVICLIRRGA